jgi:hypothetical protein
MALKATTSPIKLRKAFGMSLGGNSNIPQRIPSPPTSSHGMGQAMLPVARRYPKRRARSNPMSKRSLASCFIRVLELV